jgi:hypothetical protein
MNFLNAFLALLPHIVVGVEAVGKALAGHQKKAAAQAALVAIANGVGAVAPQHAEAASTAAAVAVNSIDGVVQVLNESGVLKKSTPESQLKFVVEKTNAPQTAPDPEEASAAPVVQEGPGLHNVVHQ